MSCTKLQPPPEPLTRGLPPPDPRSLCPLSSTEFVEPLHPPGTKFLGTPLVLQRRMEQGCRKRLKRWLTHEWVTNHENTPAHTALSDPREHNGFPHPSLSPLGNSFPTLKSQPRRRCLRDVPEIRQQWPQFLHALPKRYC